MRILKIMKRVEKMNHTYLGMLGIMSVLFLMATYMIVQFGIQHLSANQAMNVAFDLFAMMVLIIIFSSCIFGRKNDSTFSFLLLSFAVDACIFCEVGGWLVDGITRLRGVNYFFNIGSNSLLIFSCGLFFFFTCKSLKIELSEHKFMSISIVIMIFMGILVEILNLIWGYFYYIDRFGLYARNPVGSVAGYVPFTYCLGITALLVLHQKITGRLKIIYLSYILVPFIISIWYMVTKLPPTFFVSTFLAVVMIYANIYIGLGQETTRFELTNAYNEVELALQKNRLTLSQIKPHFIFNVLGSIEELCYVDADKAGNAVHYFAKYLRANMDALGEKDMTAFTNELDHIRNYIWLEKVRFEEELDYTEELEVETFFLPTLCVQPLIENAVKHGMMGKEEGTLHVILRTKETDSHYVIQIEDDGCGFDVNEKKADGRSHVGLSYVKTCLEKKVNGSMEVESTIGEGTTITMYLPKVK